MNKTELVAAIADEAEITKSEAHKVLSAFLDVITKALENGDKVVLTGFGTFEVRQSKERYGVNPRTRERLLIPARSRPAFSAGALLRDAVVATDKPKKKKEAAKSKPAAKAKAEKSSDKGGGKKKKKK